MSPVPGTDANSERVESASISRGYAQATSTTTAALLSALVTIPAGATKVLLLPSAAVRIRDDGTAPTASVGYPLATATEWAYDGSKLAALQVIGAATVDCWFYS